MNKHYKCLECNKSGSFHMLKLKNRNKARTVRLKCRRCGSFNICRINDLTDEILQINCDIVAPCLDSRIDAMTEEQRKLEIFLLKID